MCAGAAVLARIRRLVFGAPDPKGWLLRIARSLGDLVRHPGLNHRLEVLGGVLAEESSAQLKGFFAGAARVATTAPARDRPGSRREFFEKSAVNGEVSEWLDTLGKRV